MTEAAYSPSLWDRVDENDPVAPRYCPHCGEQLAHPDDLEENDDVDVADRYAAYRRHRQTHYAWGDDVTDANGDDPYLADSYDTSLTDDGKRVKGDAKEEVAGVYDVTIYYEAVLKTRVVAPSKHDAKDRAKDLKLYGDPDLYGEIPSTEITHDLHDEVREVRSLTRHEIVESEDVDEDEDDGHNYAERLPGWPW